MSDLIERQAAIDAVEIGNLKPWLIDVLQEIIKEIPSAEKTGNWIKHDDEVLGLTYECSVCHIEGMLHSPYCPNCGARMEG